MSEENVEVVRRGFASANAADWDAVVEGYDPEVEFRDLRPTPDTPEVFHGHASIRRVLALWTEVYDEFGAEVYEYVDADPWVICDTRWHGKAKGSDVHIENRVADGYEVRDGRIVRAIMSFPDIATALRTVGLAA
jgi:ketosteroid isomerase-like protein